MKGYLQLVGFWWVRGDEHTPNEGHHSVCGRVQTAAVLVQATVLLSPQSFQFSVLAKCLSVCPAFFCQRDAGESEKEIWNRWKKILSITFPQTLPTYRFTTYMCKSFQIVSIFFAKKLGMQSWYIWGLMLESDKQCSHKNCNFCKNGISTSSKGALRHVLLQIFVPVFVLYLFCYNATCSCLHVLLCLRRLLFSQVSNLLPFFAFHTRDRVCKQSRHYFFLFC